MRQIKLLKYVEGRAVWSTRRRPMLQVQRKGHRGVQSPIDVKFEDDLVREIARIANLSMKLGYQLEKENRMLSKEEAYVQIGHSASLLKGILDYSTR